MRWRSRKRSGLIAAAIACSLFACRGQPTAPASAEDRFAELRRRVATDPRDAKAHRDLARIYAAKSVPAAALRHFERARGARTGADSRALAELYVERAKARLDAQDFDAESDLARARELGARIPRELAERSIYASVIAAFRRADPPGVALGRQRLETARTRFGPDPRLALIRPALSSNVDLGEAALWLEEGRAKKIALQMFRLYDHRGGSKGEVLRGLARMERWWGAQSAVAAEKLDARLLAAVDAWLRGARSRLIGDLRAEIVALTAEQVATAPSWAQPTYARVRGEPDMARSALETAIRSVASMPHTAQALITIESALQRPSAPLPRASGELAWLAYARARRAGVPGAIESDWTADVPTATRAIDLRIGVELDELAAAGDELAAGAIARLAKADPASSAVLGFKPPLAATWVPPLGAVDPLRLAIDLDRRSDIEALTEITRAIDVDPVLAERLATEWLDQIVAPHLRGPAIVELFARAGDPLRASIFAERLLESSPDHPEFLELAAVRAAATGNTARAEILASRAAARSGDAGLTLRRLASEFVAVGAHLSAVAAGKRALGLSAPEHAGAIRLIVARAMLQLDRRQAAAALLEHPGPGRQPAGLAALEGAVEVASSVAPDTLAWNPSDHRLLAARALSDAADAKHAAARLAALALYSPDPQPLESWAAVLEKKGRTDDAAAARREAASRRGQL